MTKVGSTVRMTFVLDHNEELLRCRDNDVVLEIFHITNEYAYLLRLTLPRCRLFHKQFHHAFVLSIYLIPSISYIPPEMDSHCITRFLQSKMMHHSTNIISRKTRVQRVPIILKLLFFIDNPMAYITLTYSCQSSLVRLHLFKMALASLSIGPVLAGCAHFFIILHPHYIYTLSSLQCRVNDPLSCSQEKHEVCVFANGQYRCECPTGVNRLADGRCLSVDECSRPSLNSCHKDAKCIDKEDGYTCECNPGFADVSTDRVNKPGRICRKTNDECGQKETYGVDCDINAACVDTPEGFQCVCQPGFADISSSVSKLPGRKCVEVVNECSTGTADCSTNADCFDRAEGYECKCRPGFVDASPDISHYPGRVCNRPKSPEHFGQISRQEITLDDLCLLLPQNDSLSIRSNEHKKAMAKQRIKHKTQINSNFVSFLKSLQPQCRDSEHCGPNEECRFNAKGEMVCQLFSQCERMNECDRNAICSNAYDGIKCQCKAGFIDISPDPYRFPGRKCVEVRNECADGSADCSPFAECVDLQQGYLCKCKMGYTDVSSRYQLQPGRKCSQGMFFLVENLL
ncbi:EGF-like domain protein [Dictyocaulus viviparus]|uniref:EGF-like domain protein n=1 Tax=Dictyocaulus viviparus TaxID=29172 RepID=A0A0D8XME6_DICVI|nr:EGF-like domain protein [Dictyocaulus viviparus]